MPLRIENRFSVEGSGLLKTRQKKIEALGCLRNALILVTLVGTLSTFAGNANPRESSSLRGQFRRLKKTMEFGRSGHDLSFLLPDGRAIIVGGMTNKIEPGETRAGPSRSIEFFLP